MQEGSYSKQIEHFEPMNQEEPLLQIVTIGVTLYIVKEWLSDLKAYQNNTPNPNPYPGAVPSSKPAITISVIGAIIILLLETGGEIAIGISDEQSEMTLLFFMVTLVAAFGEELIFRGFLIDIIKSNQRTLLCILLSIIFTLLHPYIWTIDEEMKWLTFWKFIHLNMTEKSLFTSLFILLNSLWFFYLRFFKFNKTQSIIPCIAAHLSSNIGVFIIKAIQGKVILF